MKEFTVIAPEGCKEWITPGKEYRASSLVGNMFSMLDDVNDEIFCLFKSCPHLNRQDWIIPADVEAVK